MRPYFGWVNSDIVKQTIDQTTQRGAALDSFPMKRDLNSRNPALNVPRRHEPVATDTIFSDTPAVDSGETSTSLCGERLIGGICLPYEIWQAFSQYTGR